MIHEATRTLVKSPPEVWAQCSDAEALERHLNGSFGEIRVTRLEPEREVAWEGQQVSGTIVIEPSAWGTRVTLTAEVEGEEEPVAEEAVAAEAVVEEAVAEEAVVEEAVVGEHDEPGPEDPPAADGRPAGFLARWRSRFRRPEPAVPEPEPEPVAEPEPEPEPVAVEPPALEPEIAAELEPEAGAEPALNASVVLSAALESLGQAHHRPFSRS